MGAPDFKLLQPDFNKYIGLPYLPNGREPSGLDCWGLVRLVYREQFGINLPAFSEVDADNEAAIEEAMARAAEGWQKVDTPRAGDAVLFRIVSKSDGKPRVQHVGIVTSLGQFLHVREGKDAVSERYDTGKWRHRVAGFYRYVGNDSPLALSANPHPLKTERVDAYLLPGQNLLQLHEGVRAAAGIVEGMPDHACILINGQPIPRDQWDKCYPAPGTRIEYRAGLGKDAGRLLGTLAVIGLAWYAAPLIAPGLMAAGGFGAAAFQGGLVFAGNLLVNSIFPVRLPEAPNTPRTAQSMNMLQGGSNQLMQFGAIPMVLGRVRYTPPLAVKPYTESNGTNSYLRQVLLWGYGPLQVSDLRIGGTSLFDFDEVDSETLNGAGDTEADRDRFDSLYARDVEQLNIGVKLLDTDPYTERTLEQEVDEIVVDFNLPDGLRQVIIDGSKAGDEESCTILASVKVRQVGEPDWKEVAERIPSEKIRLASAWYNTDSDAALEKVYRWSRFSLDKTNNIIVRHGAYTTNPDANPTGTLLTRLQQDNTGLNAVFARLPERGPEEELLWDVCMYGDSLYTSVDRRGSAGLGAVSGCGMSYSNQVVTIASGSITRVQVETVSITRNTEKAFGYKVRFRVPRGRYEIRVKRTNDATDEFKYHANSMTRRRFHSLYLNTITGFTSVSPISFPKPLAMTAMRARASNQLNGTMEGITGTVTSICPDWDRATGTWITRPTRNPASLYRWLYQGPFTARRVADSGMNLVELADWHEYCQDNGFTFDMLIAEARSRDSIARDICAAGRASPARADGKRTVIIDRLRTRSVQKFTPANSWGFKGQRALIKMPHAWRIEFNNSTKGFQPDEMRVYADGFSAANATVYERLSLPGRTVPSAIYKDGRYHLAQLKLRPERYTINADWENILCRRGDLVYAAGDVPMWGYKTGRIKNRLSSTVLEFDDEVTLAAGKQYALHIRMMNGNHITRTVAAVGTAGVYRQVTLTTSVSVSEGEAGCVWELSEVGEGNVELIVIDIKRGVNHTAVITLEDYAPAIFDSDSEPIPEFDSQITQPAGVLSQRISAKPIVVASQIRSDESVMVKTGPGKYLYRIRVPFSGAAATKSVTHVEAQIEWAGDTTTNWETVPLVPVTDGCVIFSDVQRGSPYKIRMRFVDQQGKTGPWSDVVSHSVSGILTPPDDVGGFGINITGDMATLSWSRVPSLNLSHYTVRFSTMTSGATWSGSQGLVERVSGGATTVLVPAMVGTYLIKAVDDDGRTSKNASLVVSTIAGLTGRNVVEVIDESAIWGGTHDGTWSSTGGLRLDSVDFMSDWATLADVTTLAYGVNGIRSSGTYEFAQAFGLGAIYTCRLTADFHVVGDNINNTMDGWVRLADVETLAGTVNDEFDAWLEVSTAQDDDPEGSPTWGAWMPFVVGDYTFRAVRFRVGLTSTAPNITPVVPELAVTVDMPDRIISDTDIVCPAAGHTVTYSQPFRVRPAVAISAEDMNTGDYPRITSQSPYGFVIRFFNSAGTGVERKYDRLIRGYGALQ